MWNYNRKYSTINVCPNWYMIRVTSMLETKCVDDGFGHFGHQDPLSFSTSVGHQVAKCRWHILSVTYFVSPTFKICHRYFCVTIERKILVFMKNNLTKDYFGGLSEMLRITKEIHWAINVFVCVPCRCLPVKVAWCQNRTLDLYKSIFSERSWTGLLRTSTSSPSWILKPNRVHVFPIYSSWKGYE